MPFSALSLHVVTDFDLVPLPQLVAHLLLTSLHVGAVVGPFFGWNVSDGAETSMSQDE